VLSFVYILAVLLLAWRAAEWLMRARRQRRPQLAPITALKQLSNGVTWHIGRVRSVGEAVRSFIDDEPCVVAMLYAADQDSLYLWSIRASAFELVGEEGVLRVLTPCVCRALTRARRQRCAGGSARPRRAAEPRDPAAIEELVVREGDEIEILGRLQVTDGTSYREATRQLIAAGSGQPLVARVRRAG